MGKYSETVIKSNRNCCLYNEYFRRSQEGKVYEFDSVGFRIWHFISDKEFQGKVDLPISKDSILMCFGIKGNVNFRYSVGRELPFLEQNHNLIFSPNNELIDFSIKNDNIEIFIVTLQSEVFFNYFPVNGSQLFMNFKEKAQKGEEVILLNSTNFQLSWGMNVLINGMIESDRVDECKHIYFKAKIIELLGLQLEQFMTVNAQEDRFKNLKKDELERIQQVKNILHENPEKNYTLLGLARSVGTNDATLKKHFKMVYGTTVFNYLNRCRMEKAHHLLQNNDYKISHVAEEVGFRYASHFSTAFKKHFGYSPAVLKNVD